MKNAASLAVIALALVACSGAANRPVASLPNAATGIAAPTSFTAASAERADDGSYRITWQAPGARQVRLFAAADADPVVKGVPVASGGEAGTAAVTGLDTGKRWYFTLVPDRGDALVIADRGLHLRTAPNFRDIGGYRAADGRWVRPGFIYRSDQLDRLNDADLAVIGSLGPALVADLRTQSEREREPDRLPPQARPLILDVVGNSEGALGGDLRQAVSAIAAGKGADMLIAANREFVSSPSARAAYGALLRRLIDGTDGPVIYHCTAGKDRTGWATAVILTLLGVPRDAIMADYLLSNSYLREKNAATVKAAAAAGAKINPAFLESVLTVRREYLQSAFDEVDRAYGSFDAYARDGLGLSDMDIAILRRKYLTPAP